MDGIGFMDLTEEEVKGLVKRLGIVKRIMRLKREVSYRMLIYCYAVKW